MSTNTAEDFAGFMLSKAYDVISNGQFKRHLVSCKDKGDSWAVTMHQQQVRIVQAGRGIQNSISRLSESPSTAQWAQICKDVIGSAQPPVKVFTGSKKCSITGEDLEYSIDLTRSCRNAKPIYVHLRFWHFFVLLWYITKIEYIIRSCTKHWMDNTKTSENTLTCPEICEHFKDENTELTEKMAALFLKGCAFVQNSVELYRQEFQAVAVLRPPPQFLEGEQEGPPVEQAEEEESLH